MGETAWLVALALSVTVGCAARQPPPEEEIESPRSFVVPICSEAVPPITLELLQVGPDGIAHKPAPNIRHYLVDLRILRSDSFDLWLLVNEDEFPTTIDYASQSDDRMVFVPLGRAQPTRSWVFSGNEYADAWPVGRARNATLASIEVSTGGKRIPVTLATIDIDGLPPQEWARRKGSNYSARAAGEPLARANLTPHCTNWIEVEPEAPHEGAESSGSW